MKRIATWMWTLSMLVAVTACGSSTTDVNASASATAAVADAALASGRTIRVPGDQPTIAAALAAAASGDTVRIAPGTYAETIALKDGVRIAGGPSTIDAAGFAHGVTGDASVKSARISGLTVQGAQAQGIFLNGSAGVRIESSTVRGSGAQGLLARGAQIQMAKVELSANAAQGLATTDSTVSIEDCRVLDNDYAGLRFDGGTARVAKCFIRNNGGTGAVRFLGAVRGQLKGSQVVDNRNVGVEVDPYANGGEGRPSVELEGNTITGNLQYGLYVMAGDVVSHGDRIDSNGFWNSRFTFDGVAATAGASLRLTEGSVSGNALRGVYVTDLDFGCADPACNLYLLVQARTRVALKQVAVERNGFSGLLTDGGGEISVRESSLSGNGTVAPRHGIWLRSYNQYDLGDGVIHTVDIPSSVTVRESKVDGNTGQAVRLDGTSVADLGTHRDRGENSLAGNLLGGVFNFTGTTVPAEGNWWGTADATAIAAMNSGPVQFVPFLNSAP
jgi:hypothetical protein